MAHGSWLTFCGIARANGTLPSMNTLILAAEASHSAPPGDDWATAAYVLMGIALLVTAIATVVVTPKAEHH